MIDLHVHSVRSDGTLTPTELVDYAMKKGLSAFALTDHDTTDGLAEAMEYADCLRKKLSEQTSEGTADEKSANAVPEIIPGIELSTDDKGTEVHVVGLFIDPTNPTFREYLTDFVNSRDVRNQKMCLKLQELGLPVTIHAGLDPLSPDLIYCEPEPCAARFRRARRIDAVESLEDPLRVFGRYADAMVFDDERRPVPRNGDGNGYVGRPRMAYRVFHEIRDDLAHLHLIHHGADLSHGYELELDILLSGYRTQTLEHHLDQGIDIHL